MQTKIILDFLQKLKQHNETEWMHANKPAYQKAKTAFQDVVKSVLAEVVLFDDSIVGLEPKQCIFRVNRDIRFSKDKRPYKENFGAAMAKGGKKSSAACYYLHLEPDNSFLAGGCYMPQPAELAKIRQEIDYNATDLRKVIEADTFKQYFGEINGEELKTAPRGYAKDHPEIDLLRKKSFTIWHKLTDKEVLSTNFLSNAIQVYHAMLPFNQFLNDAMAGAE